MKKLKLYAWDVENKQMSEGATLKHLCLRSKKIVWDWEDDAAIIIESVGLEDKNGKDIRGDCDYLSEGDVIYMLRWWKEKAGWWLYFWDGEDWDWNEQIDDFYNYKTGRVNLEVIGNKFEDPKLVKEIKDDKSS